MTSGLKIPKFIIEGVAAYTETCAVSRLRRTMGSFISTRRSMGAKQLRSGLDMRLLVVGCDDGMGWRGQWLPSVLTIAGSGGGGSDRVAIVTILFGRGLVVGGSVCG